MHKKFPFISRMRIPRAELGDEAGKKESGPKRKTCCLCTRGGFIALFFIAIILGLILLRVNAKQAEEKQISSSIPLTILKTLKGEEELRGEYEGYGPTPTPITIPEEISVTLPTGYVDKLEAYASDGYNQIYPVIIGPRGWKGEVRTGENGSTVLEIYPPGGSAKSGPRISYYEIPASFFSYVRELGIFFPELYELIEKDAFMVASPVTPHPNITGVPINQQLLSYRLPNTDDGLEVKGVAYTGLDENNKPEPPFINLTVTLPKDQRDLATTILNVFIERNLAIK